MLIATVPSPHELEVCQNIIAHPLVTEVRFNTGSVSPFDPLETLERLVELTDQNKKKLWIDLKGSQLRIAQWAVPNYGKIVLNHSIEVDLPAKIYFRGNDYSIIDAVEGNVVYVHPRPRYAVGQGQAVNIHGDNLKIEGYLTGEDRLYIEAAKKLKLYSFMLSFIESTEQIGETLQAIGQSDEHKPELVLKIETPKGCGFVSGLNRQELSQYQLMAARDDLLVNIGENKFDIIAAQNHLLSLDANAILASRIFSGIEKTGELTMGDIADLTLAWNAGYRNFMLSDGVSYNCFDHAMKSWAEFLRLVQRQEVLVCNTHC